MSGILYCFKNYDFQNLEIPVCNRIVLIAFRPPVHFPSFPNWTVCIFGLKIRKPTCQIQIFYFWTSKKFQKFGICVSKLPNFGPIKEYDSSKSSLLSTYRWSIIGLLIFWSSRRFQRVKLIPSSVIPDNTILWPKLDRVHFFFISSDISYIFER